MAPRWRSWGSATRRSFPRRCNTPAVNTEDTAPDGGGTARRIASVAVLVGVVAAIIAGATIWLVLTDPVTVATALDDGDISPVVEQLAEVIYNALVNLLSYL